MTDDRQTNAFLEADWLGAIGLIIYADFSPVLQMLPDYMGNMCSKFLFL